MPIVMQITPRTKLLIFQFCRKVATAAKPKIENITTTKTHPMLRQWFCATYVASSAKGS